MPKRYAVILAGGRGYRLANETPKQFLDLVNRPIIAWSLEKFDKLSEINGILVAVPDEFKKSIQDISEKQRITKLVKIVAGGATRQGSAYNVLCSMDFGDDDILIFHDAARPFIKKNIVKECIKEAELHGASGVYVKAVDTIAKGGEFIDSIPPREGLYYTQTPQAFRFSTIKEAHEKARSRDILNATDDVQLVIDSGHRVKIVEGDPGNIKITTPFDLELARFLADRDY